MEGYIKLYRRMLDNPLLWKDSEYMSVWMYLLLNATHADMAAMFMGNRITLNPGQLLTGRKAISGKTHIDESKVQRILKKLETEQQIEQQTCNQNRLITILNWSVYQSGEQQIKQQVNNDCTTSEQQVNTNKNVKNVKNVKKKIVEGDALAFPDDSFEIQCVNSLVQSCLRQFQGAKVPNTTEEKQSWCEHIEKMKRLDGRTEEEINEALTFATTDSFWKTNIRSAKKFREKFETLIVQSRNRRQPEVKKTGFNNFEQRDYSYDEQLKANPLAFLDN